MGRRRCVARWKLGRELQENLHALGRRLPPEFFAVVGRSGERGLRELRVGVAISQEEDGVARGRFVQGGVRAGDAPHHGGAVIGALQQGDHIAVHVGGHEDQAAGLRRRVEERGQRHQGHEQLHRCCDYQFRIKWPLFSAKIAQNPVKT